MNDRVARHWPLIAALGLLPLLLAALGVTMVRATGGHLVYPLDDTYIEMAIAKNLAAHGTWGVTRFAFSGAGTSLAWPPLLAALDRLTGLAVRLPIIVNALFALVVTILAYVVLARHIVSRAGQAAALVLLIVAAPLPVLALIGMEHTLECAAALGLTIAAVAWCAAPADGDRRLAIAVPLLACLTVAARDDAASVVVAVVVLIVATRGWRAAAPTVAASAIAPLIYAAMARRHGWPALPAPILTKQRLTGIEPLSWHGAADLLGGGALSVLVNWPSLLVLVLLAAALVAWSPRERDDRLERESLYLLLVFLIATAIHLQFGRLGWLYRYEAYLVVLGIVANAAALARRLPARWPAFDAARWAGAAALAAIMLHALLLRTFLASRDVVTGAVGLYQQDYAWSQFFREHPPAGGLIVASMGTVGYYTDAPIVDLAGLATLELLPASASSPGDVVGAHRLARARGVRVSLIEAPQEHADGWQCVASWQEMSDPTPGGLTWIYAADDEAAASLARDLRAFAGTHRDDGFTITLAEARRACRAKP